MQQPHYRIIVVGWSETGASHAGRLLRRSLHPPNRAISDVNPVAASRSMGQHRIQLGRQPADAPALDGQRQRAQQHQQQRSY